MSFLTRAPALRDVPGVSLAASATMTALCSLPFPRGTPCTSVGQHPRRSRPCPSHTRSKRQRDRPLSPTAHAPQRPGGQTGESGSAVLRREDAARDARPGAGARVAGNAAAAFPAAGALTFGSLPRRHAERLPATCKRQRGHVSTARRTPTRGRRHLGRQLGKPDSIANGRKRN